MSIILHNHTSTLHKFNETILIANSQCAFCFCTVCLAFHFQDCSVIFVNGDSGIMKFFNKEAFIEFMTMGPVEHTECRIDKDDKIGTFSDCK